MLSVPLRFTAFDYHFDIFLLDIFLTEMYSFITKTEAIRLR